MWSQACFLNKKAENIFVLQNIEPLKKHRNLFYLSTTDCEPIVIALTENWLNRDSNKNGSPYQTTKKKKIKEEVGEVV